MTTEYYARIEYTYSSGDAIFSIPFSYIDAQYIKVYVNGEKTSGWLFVNESQIQVTLPKLVTGDVVIFQRETPINEKLVTFTDTSILDEETQNLAQDQVFNAIQEIYDNNEVFKIETNDTLASDKAEIEGIVEANRQELLAQVASDKTDTDRQIENFKTEVNTTIEQVSEAAAKINELEEAVNTAVTAATTASEKADNAAEEVAKAKTEVNNAKEEVKNAKEEVVKATEQAQIATAKAEEAKQTVESSLTEIENKTQTEINKIKQTGFYMENGELYYTDSEGNSKKFTQGGGLPLASIYLAPFGIDESKNLGRYLNGQVIMQSQFTAFTTKVKSWQTTRPDLFTTETNWQAEKTASKLGQCGKFVVDDTAGTIRLPLVININGLTDLTNCGVVKDESLPNIKTTQTTMIASTNQTASFNLDGGCVKTKAMGTVSTGGGSGADSAMGIDFDASNSSSTYQDNAPVQQEAIQYPYVIVVNTGIEEAERPINNYQVNNVYSYGVSQYYKGVMNNNSWLRSAGQWNPGTRYNGVYEWAVAQQVAGVDGFKLSTEEYTDYDWVLNTEEQTFRLPVLAERILVESKVNGTQGYNLYSDGWCEQWGISQMGGSGVTVQLLKQFANTDFSVLLTCGSNTTGWPVAWTPNSAKTTSSFYFDGNGNYTSLDRYIQVNWKVSGYAAIPTSSPYNLYYYIGDVLENADLINIARMQEELVDKTTAAQAAHAAMPSDKYIDLTLGASGTTYTAPADGYVSVIKEPGSTSYPYMNIIGTVGIETYPNYSNQYCRLFLPVIKNTIFSINYNLLGTTHECRFYYAVGSEPTA